MLQFQPYYFCSKISRLAIYIFFKKSGLQFFKKNIFQRMPWRGVFSDVTAWKGCILKKKNSNRFVVLQRLNISILEDTG